MTTARTRRLDADVDLFDVAGPDGDVFEKGAIVARLQEEEDGDA